MGEIILWTAAAVVLLFLLFTLVVGYYMYRFAIVRRNQVDYWTEQSKKSDIFTDEEYADIVQGEKFIRENVGGIAEIESDDGLRLRARIIEAENPTALVIMVHGYRSHPVCDFSCAAQTFADYGFSMLMIHHRAHGLSEGKHITFGVKESRDLCRWTEYARKRYGELPVILDGVSMGGATVMMSMAENLGDNVKAVIADCGYTTPGEICRKVLYQWFRLRPFPIYYGAKIWTKLLADFDLDSRSSVKALRDMGKRSDHPCILIAHGKADDFVPFSMGEECRAALAEDDPRVWFVASENAGHGLAYIKDREKYTSALFEMFEAAGININGIKK